MSIVVITKTNLSSESIYTTADGTSKTPPSLRPRVSKMLNINIIISVYQVNSVDFLSILDIKLKWERKKQPGKTMKVKINTKHSDIRIFHALLKLILN